MKVICAGMSKTGTKSLAKALRILGYTVYDYPEHLQFHQDEWLDIYCLGKSPDFVSMYQGVDAVTDYPAAFWYEEIYQAFPDAKVVLTIRDNDESWAQSFAKHVEMREHYGGFVMKIVKRLPNYRKFFILADAIFTAAYGSPKSKSTVLFKKKYREHNQRVQLVIPEEKLLIFNVKQGWKPLCEFLGCDVPEEAFPRENVGSSLVRTTISKWHHDFVIKIVVIFAAFLFLLIACYFTVCL